MIKFEFDKNQLKIKNNLNSEIKSNVLEFNKLIKNINPERIKEIHEFRKLAKKLRYQVEFTNSQKILKTYDLKKIKHIQSVTGKIQNDSALIDNLDQFLKAKKNNSKTKVLKIKKDIQNHQSKLIHQNLTELSALK